MEIFIHKDSWDTIINYAKAAYHTEKAEIGGMAVVLQDKEGNWTIEDPQIVKQEIAGTTCDLDKEELAMYYTRAAMEYKNENFRFCWWHSHHTMDAFWSGTDLTAIKEYSDGDFSFALVINLKGKHIFRVSCWKPFEMHIDTKVELLEGEERKMPKKILNDVEKLCSKRSFVYGKNYKQTKYTPYNSQQTSLIKAVDVDSDMEAKKAIELVTSINYRFAAGELDFKGWMRIVNAFNLNLNDWYIDDVITEAQLKKDVIHRKSEDFIEPLYSAEDMATVLSEEGIDDKKDEWYFNQSYGGIY